MNFLTKLFDKTEIISHVADVQGSKYSKQMIVALSSNTLGNNCLN